MQPSTVAIPLVGGPGDGTAVETLVGPEGTPPLTHSYVDADRHLDNNVATYELESTADGGAGWQYVFRPNGPSQDGDFATEHASPSLADEMDGGPEGLRENDSPRGLAGAD